MRNINQSNKSYWNQLNLQKHDINQVLNQYENNIFICNKNAILYLLNNNPIKALPYISEAKLLASKAQQSYFGISRQLKITTFNNLCSYYIKKSSAQQALKFIHEAVKYQQKQPINHISYSRTLLNKSFVYLMINKLQQSKHIAEIAFEQLKIYINQRQSKNTANNKITESIILSFMYILTEIECQKPTKQLIQIYKLGFQYANLLCTPNSEIIFKMNAYLQKYQNRMKNSVNVRDGVVTNISNRMNTEYEIPKSIDIFKSPYKNENRYIEMQRNKKYKISHTNRIINNKRKNIKEQMQQISDTNQLMNKDQQKKFINKKKNKYFQIHLIDSKARKKGDDQDQMKQLQKIKKIYQPLKNINKIQYIYQPNIMQGTSKFEFSMIPINKSLCNNQNSLHIDFKNNKSITTKYKSQLFQLRQNTKETNSSKQKNKSQKKNKKFNIKTKKVTQTPTLITIQSFQQLPVNKNIKATQKPNSFHTPTCDLI